MTQAEWYGDNPGIEPKAWTKVLEVSSYQPTCKKFVSNLTYTITHKSILLAQIRSSSSLLLSF